MAEDEIMIEDDAIALEDSEDTSVSDVDVNNIIPFILERYKRSEDYRYQDEERWLKAYRNYRGLYGPDVQFSESEKSRVFIKVTKTKTLAAYGQIVDVLFANQRFPLSVEPTELPEGVVADVHFDPKEPEQLRGETALSSPYGFAGDGMDFPAGATAQTLQEKLGVLENKLEPVAEKLKEGPGETPTAIAFSPAMIAAKKMQKKIHDQLEESGASKHLRNAAFEMALFGTGVMKGPFAIDKEYPNWNDDGEYDPRFKTVPQVNHVSVWNFYPDPDANNMDEAQYVVERHKMSRTQLRGLKNRPYFRKDVIDEVIAMGENYTKQYWENDLIDYAPEHGVERFEVLEYWGIVDKTTLQESGLKVPEEFTEENELQINAWVTEGRVLRMVLNPFQPYRLPYHAFPYERNPYSFFGIGVPENMSDAQAIMNGHARMAIDNLALSGSLVFDIDESALVAGQSMDVYPGKIFRRQAGMPGQAVHGLKFPNTATENMMMFDKFRQLADESTGIPSYSHGQTGVQSMTRTASGMSMLLSAANLNVKTVIKNIDDYLLRPLGESFFQWNMQFYDGDLNIEGDLEIRATGTASLMQKEVRSQRLTMFLQTVQNPAIAPFVKISEIIKELAYSLDLDPDEVINDPAAAEIYAKIIGLQNAQQQGQEQPPGPGVESAMGGAQGVPPEVAGTDSQGTGNGTIGTGNVSQPGEMEFTGTVDTPPGQPQE